MSNDELRVDTAATLSRVVDEITNSGYKGEFKVDALLRKLADNDIKMNRKRLIELSKREPWSNFISNIRGDTVVFVGDPSDGDSVERDSSSKTLDKMAKRAAKSDD